MLNLSSHTFVLCLEEAYKDSGVSEDQYTSSDGMIVTRIRKNGHMRCFVNGTIGGNFAVTGRSEVKDHEVPATRVIKRSHPDGNLQVNDRNGKVNVMPAHLTFSVQRSPTNAACKWTPVTAGWHFQSGALSRHSN